MTYKNEYPVWGIKRTGEMVPVCNDVSSRYVQVRLFYAM
jgi:hypothetical protein